jgi:hypothetical protein
MSSQSKTPATSKTPEKSFDRNCGDLFDLHTLLHPAGSFAKPAEVVRDPTLNEKRAILASWASDACAIEAAPALRQPPGAARPVSFDDVMDALRVLDRQAGDYHPPPRYRRVLAKRAPGVFGRGARRRSHSPEGEGQPLN